MCTKMKNAAMSIIIILIIICRNWQKCTDLVPQSIDSKRETVAPFNIKNCTMLRTECLTDGYNNF